jgi:hypothetical protein
MPCVYTTPPGLCDGDTALSPNEHYLPRALGNFQDNEPLVNRICDGCPRGAGSNSASKKMPLSRRSQFVAQEGAQLREKVAHLSDADSML